MLSIVIGIILVVLFACAEVLCVMAELAARDEPEMW